MAIESTEALHVVMFPFFAFGHISPFVQLSNKLSVHGIKISFLSAAGNISRIRNTLKLNPSAQIIPLSIPHVEGLPPDLQITSDMTPAMAELVKLAIDLMQPQIKIILSELKPHFVFFDFAQNWLPHLASQFGIKSLSFSVFAALTGSYIMVPERRNNHSTDVLIKPPTGFPATSITSLREFEGQNLQYVFMNFGGPCVYDRVLDGLNNCDAVVIKTCNEIERPYVDFQRSIFQKPVLLTGPLVPEAPSGELEETWAKWLGQFATKSVIFCSFGSETFLNDDQINGIALGLELSGLPFILVLNFPANVDAQTELLRALPEGFIDRVRDRGIVHTGWVQQQLILAHNSVGCHVCHSGFTSVIEAIMNDCQLVLLPFKGDQFFNAKLIAGELRAGVEVKRRGEDGHFNKEDIFEAVKTVMVEINKEPGLSIAGNHQKWREFFSNEGIQNKYIEDLVKELKVLLAL